MAVEFFNFGNEETFHAFKWVSECGHPMADPESLIDAAYKDAETSADHFDDEDGCVMVRDHLAERLRIALDEIAKAETAPDHLGMTEEFQIGRVWKNAGARWLVLPLLFYGLARLNYVALAEALLIRAGKWAPSKEPPEII
jgi:hypothetical protein